MTRAAAEQVLTYTRTEARVGHVTLSRPGRLNAINAQLRDELWSLLQGVDADDGVHVLVISGAPRSDGRPCFCAGADVKDVAAASGQEAEQNPADLVRAMMVARAPAAPSVAGIADLLESMSTPSIAAIDGVCTAGGLELALACDLRVAAETAEISDLHIRNLGHIGGGGVAVRLQRAVGSAWAKEVMFTGAVVPPQTALRIGLVNHVYPADELLARAMAQAERIAGHRAAAIGMAKAVIGAAEEIDKATAIRYSLAGRRALYSAAGYRALTEKKGLPTWLKQTHEEVVGARVNHRGGRCAPPRGRARCGR
ncbi:MAG TPA: enoyl-CoA hydratase/isomerase family protein [Trebonia sp.]|jgi:enoyl-CoA hydratase/carnithine racemase